MLVALDGRSVSHPRKGGFKTYIENLLMGFQQINQDHRFLVCYDRDFLFPPLTEDDLFREVVVRSRVKYIGQVTREHIGLPLFDRGGDGLKPDLWHFPYNTAPYAGVGNYVLTLHDMTSYTHKARFDWSKPKKAVKELALFYYPRAMIKHSANQAKIILTVSNYAKDCIVGHLGVDADKVIVTPLAAQDIYRPLSPEEKAQANQVVEKQFGIRRPFILTVASSLMKNPQGAIEAFAQLPEDLRCSHDLVIVMAYSRFRETVEKTARENRVHNQIILLLNLDPEELLILYNLTELLLYPSFTESFPLPTAEAMACGTPIICSNGTGFPEQVGDAAIMVEPTDSQAVAEKLCLLLRNKRHANDLRERSLRRRKLFSWSKTAQLTLDAYETALLG